MRTRIAEANDIVAKLHSKLEIKSYEIAKQYFQVSDFKSAIVAINNVFKDFPDSKYNEELSLILIKANYLLTYNGSNHIIANNIFKTYCYVATGASATITQNVFNAEGDGANTIDNSTLQNNIFNKLTTAMTFTNCTVEYNMAGSPAILPTGNNNQNNVSMSTVFINNNGNNDGEFVLKSGSPAIGAGIGGADMGAYGGSSPFKLAVQPAVPAIYKIQAPAAPAGNSMNVIFSTRSNN